VLSREPGGTATGEQIRNLLLAHLPGSPPIDRRTDALLFNAARAQLVAEVIEPALAAGRLVIATRYSDSTLAYQGHGSGLPRDDLAVLADFATGGLTPDLTIVLDLPIEAGLHRKAAEMTRFETAFDLDFHRRVRAGYLAIAATDPSRYAIVDASAPEAEVFNHVIKAIRDRIPALGIAFDVSSGSGGPGAVSGRAVDRTHPENGESGHPRSAAGEPGRGAERMYR
jgi:dTMP kinase